MVVSAAEPEFGRPPGDGAGGGGDHWINVPALAWEFLRRNPDYRDDYARCASASVVAGAPLDRRWGLRFPADPRLTAERACVFWRPDVAPGIVLPIELSGEGRALRALPAGETRRAEDGVHVRTVWGLQLLLKEARWTDQLLSVALAFDMDFRLRVRAAEVLERVSSGRPPPKSRLSATQWMRLTRCLAALDAALEGMSYRQIAERLFSPTHVAEEVWKTGSTRAVTIRLVRAGKALMQGGYLKLLRDGF